MEPIEIGLWVPVACWCWFCLACAWRLPRVWQGLWAGVAALERV